MKKDVSCLGGLGNGMVELGVLEGIFGESRRGWGEMLGGT